MILCDRLRPSDIRNLPAIVRLHVRIAQVIEEHLTYSDFANKFTPSLFLIPQLAVLAKLIQRNGKAIFTASLQTGTNGVTVQWAHMQTKSMQLKSLKVFCDVVARHSFSKAATDNDMTQSGASQAVQQLEEFLRVQLIDRSKRPFVLTAEGRAFYGGCVQLVRQFETLAEEVRSISQEVSGRASLAVIYSVGLSYLPQLQKQLKERHPQADLRTQMCHPDDVYRLVEQGNVDFGLVSFPEQSKHISAIHWRDEPMLLVAPSNHRMAAWDKVNPEDLGLEGLVAFAPNLRIRHEIDRYLRHLGITMRIASELDNIDSVKHALEVDASVAFLPEPTVREEIEAGSLVALKCDWLKLHRPLGIIQRRNSTLGRTARGVLELILASGDKPEQNASKPANLEEATRYEATPAGKARAGDSAAVAKPRTDDANRPVAIS